MTAPHRDVESAVPTNATMWLIPIGKYAHLVRDVRWVSPEDYTDERFYYTYRCFEAKGQSHTQFVKRFDGTQLLCAACGFEYERDIEAAHDEC